MCLFGCAVLKTGVYIIREIELKIAKVHIFAPSRILCLMLNSFAHGVSRLDFFSVIIACHLILVFLLE